MKRLFFVALTALALAACTNDEMIGYNENKAIQFGDVILDKAKFTRATDPSLNHTNIDGFNVWSFMDDFSSTILKGDEVTKTDEGWAYDNTQFWFPDHTYYFAALAPMKEEGVTNWTIDTTKASEKGLGVVTFENKNGTEDLVYAQTSVTTPADINTYPGEVKLVFNHLLSKVKFTFKNGFADANTSVTVKDIKMTAPSKATIDLTSDKKWGLDTTANDTTLEFGDVAELNLTTITSDCADERLTIPAEATQEYTVSFTVEIKVANQIAQVINKTTTLTGVTLEPGKAYNLVAELNPNNMGLYPITFDVEVKGWVNEPSTIWQ